MNVFLFILAIIVSFIVVRIGAIVFELTGLERGQARFQALSCFTGTGFTTREAELITGNPQRRRIATILMILGHAGLVALVATFANSIRPSIALMKFKIPFLDLVIPSYLLPWANLIVIVATVYLVYRHFPKTKLARKMTEKLRRYIKKKDIIKPVSFEEVFIADGGYGVSHVEICQKSPLLDKTLAESGLRAHDIMILAVEREGETIPNPPENTKMLIGDKLICFGKLENIRKEACDVQMQKNYGQ